MQTANPGGIELPGEDDLYLVLSNDNKVVDVSAACRQLLPAHIKLDNEHLEKVIPLLNLVRNTPGWKPTQNQIRSLTDQRKLLMIQQETIKSPATKLNTYHVDTILESINIGVIQLSENYYCNFSNRAFTKMTGLTAQELTGKNWLNAIHEQDTPQLSEALQEFERTKNGMSLDIRAKKPLGDVRWLRLTLNAVYAEDGTDLLLLQAEDITDAKTIEKTRWNQQYIDPLTQLYNRQGIEKQLSQQLSLAAKTGKSLFVYTLDLDCFKRVNDEFGHDTGDKLLIGVGAYLKNHLPHNCVIGRSGGDVFNVIFVNQPDTRSAATYGHKIVNVVNTYYQIGNKAINISCSVGGIYEQPANSEWQNNNDTNNNDKSTSEQQNYTYWANRLLKQSDKALQKAKQRGRNQFRLLDKESTTDNSLQYTILNDIPWSLRKSHFFMVYQPIVDSQSQQPKLLEALIRWQHPKLGMISPGQFIPLAESAGAMIPLGDWLLERVFKEFSNFCSRIETSLSISVNLSSYQLDDDYFFTKLTRLEERYSIPPEMVVFEITETVLIHDTDKIAACLKELSRRGYRLALDDFGTGYSSLSYLHRFNFDLLKIDKSFVQNMVSSKPAKLLVSNIVSLAHGLDLPVIAEGVESTAELGLLTEKCEFLQGFYFAKPGPIDTFVFE